MVGGRCGCGGCGACDDEDDEAILLVACCGYFFGFHFHQKIAIYAMIATISGTDINGCVMISTARAEG
jgi:hypothetical protein